MPKSSADKINQLLVKSVDFCKFLATFSEDLKIEGIPKQTKCTKADIFYRLVCYNPVRDAAIVKLRRDLIDK